MRALTGTLSLVLIGAVGAGSAVARKVAIAPLGALGIESSEARKVERRVRVEAAKLPGVRLVARERLARLLRAARNYGCAERPRCIGPLARKVGARVVVVGEVGGIAGEHVVYLKLVDRKGTVVRSVTGVLPTAQPGAREPPDPAGTPQRESLRSILVRLLAPSRHTGTLRVEVDVDGAWIYLDGQRSARGQTAVLRRVTAGTHALRVTHENYRDDVRFVRVEYGQEAVVRVELRAFRSDLEEMRLRRQDEPLTSAELPWYRRWWVLAAFGAAVLTASATTVALIPKSVSADQRLTLGLPPAQ